MSSPLIDGAAFLFLDRVAGKLRLELLEPVCTGHHGPQTRHTPGYTLWGVGKRRVSVFGEECRRLIREVESDAVPAGVETRWRGSSFDGGESAVI